MAVAVARGRGRVEPGSAGLTAALLTKAAAHVAADQPEQAAATAHIALPIARRAGSRRILHQLGQIGTAVDEHRHLADVRALLDDLVETA